MSSMPLSATTSTVPWASTGKDNPKLEELTIGTGRNPSRVVHPEPSYQLREGGLLHAWQDWLLSLHQDADT
jgi:hypothetical protein